MDSEFEEESEEEISENEIKLDDLTIAEMCAELKSILLNPKLFLANYFSNLRNSVDIAHETFIITQKQVRRESESSTTDGYSAIIERINCFEKECLEKPVIEEDTDFKKISNVLSQAELKINDTLWLEVYATKDEQEKLSDMIYECLLNSKKLLFGNSTMIFWTKHEVNKGLINSFGKLLLISDEYIGARAFKDFKKLWYYGNVNIEFKDSWLHESHDIVTFAERATYIERDYNYDVFCLSNDHLKLLYLISYIRRECWESFRESPVTEIQLSLLDKRICSLDSLNFVKAAHDLFDGNLRNIEKLNLSSNTIEEKLNPDVFQNLKSLKLLDLNNNQIPALPRGIFRELNCLLTLDIADNLLRGLPIGCFSELNKLVLLDLSCNKISSISFGIFQGLKSLKKLNLADNKLVEISEGCFDELSKLIDINLSSNSITNLPSCVFHKLEFLKVISLKKNQLASLEDGVFNRLWTLEELILSNNKIKSLQASCFKDLRSLKILHLDCNEITSVPYGIFSQLIKVEEINLSYNHLKEIPNDVFENLSFLNTVKLHCDEVKETDGYISVNIGSNCIIISGWLDFERTSTGKVCNSLKHVFIKKITAKDVLSNH